MTDLATLELTSPAPDGALPPGAVDGDFERLVVVRDAPVGLLALICIDSTRRGPADGGVRMRPYPDFAAAVTDVTRLARAMTRKWALAGEDRGGGKAVIVGDPRRDKTPALLRSFARAVDDLGGTYWAGEDVGTTLDDMAILAAETPYVATAPLTAGGAGDIAPATAAGVLHAMRACVERVWGSPSLAGRRVALQGLGACGAAALDQLVAEGAEVVVTDVDPERVAAAVARHGVAAVAPDAILDVEADVFAPFALGGVIDARAVDRLRVRVVAGSANDVLADPALERDLIDRGITYAVDVVANAGGAIMDADRFLPGGPDPERVAAKVAAIGERTAAVLDEAARRGVTATEVALELADRRLGRPGGPVGP